MSQPAHRLALQTSGGERPPPSGTERRSRVLTLDQIKLLLRVPIGRHMLRDKALVSFLFSTGCRVSEASDCKIGYLDIARGRVNYYRRKRRDWLESPLGLAQPRVLAYLRASGRSLLRKQEPLFLSQKGGRLRRSTIRGIFKRLCQDCGIPPENSFVHILRATRATTMLEAGVPRDYVSALLGHSAASSLDAYVRLARGPLDSYAALGDA